MERPVQASGSKPREKVRQAWGSRSTTRVRRPSSAEATPSEWTVVVLATPPFWLATARTSVTGGVYACPRAGPGHGQAARRRSGAGHAHDRAGQPDVPPIEPKKGAEKLNTPPSAAANR